MSKELKRPPHKNLINVDTNYAIDLNKYIDQLESKLKAVEGLLEVAVCPNHCNNGAIQVAEDDWEQCEWCGVKNELKKQ